MTEPGWAQELQRLRRAYGSRLALRVAELRARVETARHSARPEDWEAAWALTHRLEGSSGSFGFDAVCAAIGQVRDGLERLRPGRAAADPEALWREIERALAAAGSHVSQTASPPDGLDGAT